MILNAAKTAWRDYQLLTGHVKILAKLKWLEMKQENVGKIFDVIAKKNPEKVCFYFEDEKWTFRQVEETSNRVGNYFLQEGFKKNDVVALYMENRPEYVCTWLGLSKAGVTPALVNYNLKSIPLKNSFEVAKSKAVICGYELSEAVSDLYQNGSSMPVYGSGKGDRGFLKNAKDLDNILPKVSSDTPTPLQPVKFFDDLFYVFTSGTTGFPKAAIIKHSRYMMGCYANHYASKLTEDDIIYMTLPLYHVAGGILSLSQPLIWGTPMVIRQRFSPQHFWKDCIHYNATAAQYIAETCRFLLRQPTTAEEKQHKIKVMFGNGLRHEIWEEFVTRFKIPNISEFYASTEGNANLVNFDNQVGAVGFIPSMLEKIYPMNLIKLDENTQEPVRDPKTGLVLTCKPNEIGELVGKIVVNSPFRDFEGYAGDPEANEKKIVRNVFQKGDQAFRTGDLLMKDDQGYYYFKDRMGDTYRWKSENVSTAEVEYIISNLTELRDVVVYGVPVPGYDGNAGMAAVADPEGSLDIEILSAQIVKTLPSYSRPVFLRTVKEIEMTGTHKMKKTDLQKEAYDLTKTSKDNVYFLLGKKYIPLTKELVQKIASGEIKA